MTRDNFKAETKRKLAERSGYICNFPGCNKITIGPSKIFKKSIITGEAAHIEAASPEGPRYNKDQTKEERFSIDNGIWMCTEHAKIIDKDDTRYSVTELKEWKCRHEENIHYRQCGISPESGSIVNISIENYGPFTKNVNIELFKNNIIWGDNGIGKTLICENLSSLIFKENIITRWVSKKRKFSSIFRIIFLKDKKHEIKIEITQRNAINYYYNNVAFANIIPPYNVVYLDDILRINQFEIDDLLKNIPEENEEEYSKIYNEYYIKQLLNFLKINIDVFVSLLKYINLNEKYFIYGFKFENNVLKAQIKSDSHLLEFTQLSGSEKQRVILELNFQLAQLYADIAPTVFLLEQSSIYMFDDDFVVSLLKLVINKNFNFQTIFTFSDLYLLKKFPKAYDNYHLVHLMFEGNDIIVSNGHCT